MTTQEFSDEFDVLYNSITSNQAPGIDEYEKSVFLTLAQYQILKSYFDPRANKVQEGFDDSQRRQIDFSMVTVAGSTADFSAALYDPRANSKSVAIPSDVLIMINERLQVQRNDRVTYLTVRPLEFTEYDRLMSKPYKRPLKWQAWRVFNYSDSTKSDLVVAPGDTISNYAYRYVKRPNPIIVADLDGLTIEGKAATTECELDPTLHHEILQRAVELAKAAYIAGDLNSMVGLGSTSQTEIGMVQSRL